MAMSRGNVLKAKFGDSKSITTNSLWQYDYGQILQIEGIELPNSYEVHFASTETQESSITQIGSSSGVIIPDALLCSGDRIFAWIYLHNGLDDGETEYQITIPVRKRAQPTNDAPTQVEQDAITQTIAALNSAVSEAELAKETIENMSVSAQTLSPNSNSTVTKSVDSETGAVTLTFGIPQGIQGEPGVDGVDGKDGTNGINGIDGYSPIVSVTKSGSVATISITNRNGTTTFTLNDGVNGRDGQDGKDGMPGFGIPDGGVRGQIIRKKSESDYDAEWSDENVPVSDVQVNGSSINSNGISNIPKANTTTLGVVKAPEDTYGVNIDNDGNVVINPSSNNDCKSGTATHKPIVPSIQHGSAFYGFAKAAGDSTQQASENSIGTYTETARSKISDMLNAPVIINGNTPTIIGMSGVRYICGELNTLSITAPESGIIDVLFKSGSTATVLTVTSAKTGVSAIKWLNGFDPSTLDANTVYEINILDGEYGVVGSWY